MDFNSELSDVLVRMLHLKSINSLSLPYPAEEVQEALKDMYPTKVPSPDGFHRVFYKEIFDLWWTRMLLGWSLDS